MKRIWLALPLVVALAACGSEGEGTTISIKGDDGNVVASADKDGRVAIKAPGFEGSLKLPKFQLDAGDFEIDGVKLYPGSTIAALNIDGKENTATKDGGTVRVQFNSPATADTVRNWFREQMETAGFTVTANGSQLAGKTGEGSPFTLKLDPNGDAKSRGTLTVTGN
ncbi:hypothetical protein [Sphingomonas sp. LT1P40]|uniref:hypothetical protein n=1 Tax=Alteristakelama amylovorans TaxID=3096166 RepID=UPI002FC67E51